MKINLSRFLRKVGLQNYEIPEPNRWVVTIPLHDSEVDYFTLDIYQSADWISFTSVVMENVSGNRLHSFYELLFRLNHFLNGLKFAIDFEGRYITLQTEIDISEFDIDSLKNVIQQFIFFYTNWYSTLVRIAAENKLKYRKPTKKLRIVDKMMQKVIASELLSHIVRPSLPDESNPEDAYSIKRNNSK
jgi:hypothetical protein